MVVEMDEDEDEEEEDGLEYATNTPLGDSYTTPPSTGGHSQPSLAPSHSPTPGDSNPENNAVSHTEELEAHIEAFLEEAEEDMEMSDLPPLENVPPLSVLAPVIPGFVPFTVSTSQCCVLPKSLLRSVWHPYQHWGQGGLETNENILSTLQALVESTCHLPANNRLGTFQMFLQVPGRTHDVGTFMEHFECNINMCNTFDPP